MKTRIPIIAIAICLFATEGAFAKPDKDDSRYTDEKVGKVQKSVEYHETRIKALEQDVENLSQELAAVKKWAEEKWGIGVKELEEANQKAEKGIRKGTYSLWLLIPVTVIILAVVGFAFWPRKTVSPSASAESSDRPKCPRCGLEHDPKDTVCKNPNCKTQF